MDFFKIKGRPSTWMILVSVLIMAMIVQPRLLSFILLAVKDPQELLALQAGALQPAAEKATAYGRQVYEIASSTQADISKLLEAQAAGAQEKFQGFVEAAMKNAPAGSENAVAMMKQAMSATSAAVESAQKAAKQAVSSAATNIQSITKAAKAA